METTIPLSEVPETFIPITELRPLEVAAWREPNGARFVKLVDDSEETWERYCTLLARGDTDRAKADLFTDKEEV